MIRSAPCNAPMSCTQTSGSRWARKKRQSNARKCSGGTSQLEAPRACEEGRGGDALPARSPRSRDHGRGDRRSALNRLRSGGEPSARAEGDPLAPPRRGLNAARQPVYIDYRISITKSIYPHPLLSCGVSNAKSERRRQGAKSAGRGPSGTRLGQVREVLPAWWFHGRDDPSLCRVHRLGQEPRGKAAARVDGGRSRGPRPQAVEASPRLSKPAPHVPPF